MGAPMTNVGASLPSYYQRREQPVSTSADIPATAPERHMLVGTSPKPFSPASSPASVLQMANVAIGE